MAGLLLAEAVVAWRASGGRSDSPGSAKTIGWISILGNNFPDLDFAYTGITEGKLGYLLHHRGHTHTLVGALGASLLLFGLALAVRRMLRSPILRGDLAWIAGVSAAGPLLHLLLDFSNNYGVHPFWPLDNRWVYGDAVFIIEPWLWVASVPCLFLTIRNRLVRVALGLALLGAIALAWVVPWGAALALTLGCFVSVGVTLRLKRPFRVLWASAAWLLVTLTFLWGSRVARARVQAVGGSNLQDVVITPYPSNPLCFNAIVVDRDSSVYRLRVATVTPFPALVAETACGLAGWNPGLPMKSVPRSTRATVGVRFIAEWSRPLAELRELNRTHCQAAAFFRFARTPYWHRVGQDTLRVGDLRYDREPELGFAELDLPLKPGRCPESVPPWEPPRHALF